MPDMRQRPYSASHMSTAKQCIPKLSAVFNTPAAAEMARFIGVHSLVLQWQGCELKESSNFRHLGENDVQLRKVEECGSGNFQSVSVHGCWPEIRVSSTTATSD